MEFSANLREGRSLSLRLLSGGEDLVLDALGLYEPQGTCLPEDFLGRVILALALSPTSPPRPAEVVKSAHGQSRVKSGLKEGYLQKALLMLHGMGMEAYGVGVPVSWR